MDQSKYILNHFKNYKVGYTLPKQKDRMQPKLGVYQQNQQQS